MTRRFQSCFVAPTCLLLYLAPARAQDKSVKEYADALKHADVRLRLVGLKGLAGAGAEAAPYAEAVARLLKDPAVTVRRAAAQVLSALGPDAEKAAPALAAALRDADPGVKFGAAKALVDLGDKAIPTLKDALADKDTAVRFWAVMILEGMAAEHPEVVKVLGAALKDSNPRIRKVALAALTKVSEPGKEVIEALARSLVDKDAGIRILAALALLENAKAEAIPHLVAAFKDAAGPIRLTAIQALASMGEEIDMEAVLTLRAALSDVDAKVRQAAALGVAGAGVAARERGEGKKLVDALFKLMLDKDTTCRQAAVFALGRVGIDDKDEIKALADGLKDKEPVVRFATIEALTQYSYEEAPAAWRSYVVAFVVEGVKDKDKRVQFAAAKALVAEGPLAVSGLVKIVETATGPTRILAAQILGEIGEGAAEALPALRKMSREGSVENRQAALVALMKIQP